MTGSPGTSRVTPRTNALDDAGALVSEDDRFRATVPLVNVDVGMIDAARDDPHEYLTPTGLLDLENFQRRRAGCVPRDGRLYLHATYRPR